MKKISTLFLTICMVLSGCGTANPSEVQGQTSAEVKRPWDINPINGESPSGMQTPAADLSGSPVAFESEDIYGDYYSQDIYAQHQLTMINVFATWCGPCIQEMPEITKLYEDLPALGYDVNIIGFVTDARDYYGYIDNNAINTADQLHSSYGISYPFIVPDNTMLNGYLITQYVPTTYFVDNQGNFVGEPVVGSRDYNGWLETIQERYGML